jgi:tRNA(Ile)-lysidine synthase
MYHYHVHPLGRSVVRYVLKHALLAPGDRVGVAVSGGADSVALLRILLEIRDEQGLVLSVAHLNHCLRGQESDDDEEFVSGLASHYDLPFHCARRDVKAHAIQHKLSIETAAREFRYRYLEALLREGSFNKLATAHTLDDQAETVLLKLSRGAGTRGLAGIYPSIRVEHSDRRENLAIVRPLLAIERSALEAYLTEISQPWREDSTNAELHHTRNRVRHEILTKLIEQVNPDIRQTLGDAAQIARADEEFWAQETERHLRSVWSQRPGGGTLDYPQLFHVALALRRRLVRAAAESIGISLEFPHVEAVLALEQEGARTALPSGWVARRQKEFISLELPAATESDYEYPLSVPGSVLLPQDGLIVAAFSPVENGTGADQRCHPDHLLDERFAQNLKVRNWRAGDRFWPSNRGAPKKIKELLQDRHITGTEKKCWPVIASGEEVIWMRGFGVRRDCRAPNGAGILITEEAQTKDHDGN